MSDAPSGLDQVISAARAQALEFTKIGDAKFRGDFLPVIRVAEGRTRTPWWPGEAVYPGCLTSGPALPSQAGSLVQTCLVQVPDSWAVSDAYLRVRHYRLPAK